MSDWHKFSGIRAVEILNTDQEKGLSAGEVQRRLEQYGPNELVERGVKSPWKILLEQFKETMVVILIIATLISALLGEVTDAAIILVIVVLNALLGFRQEYQAERSMAALKKLSVPTVRVRRDGHVLEVGARELVPGDIVLLEAGNLVPADCRLLTGVNLRIQEAALTGESEPVSKDAGFVAEEAGGQGGEIPIAERHNMIYMGTIVTYGRGEAVVASTGMETELGNIADLMQSAGQEPTPLQRRLAQLGKGLAIAALVLVIIVFGLGWLRGEDLEILFLTSIGIAVAAVPEGLPAVVTISLALGAKRMLARKALIRKLPAVEALGSVTVICSDKTGTLTENRMTVTVLDMADNRLDLSEEEMRRPINGSTLVCADPEPEHLEQLSTSPALTLLLAGGALCNDAILECDDNEVNYRIIGDPTEGALLIAAAKLGLSHEALETSFPRLAEAPFDSDRKRMTTLHRIPASENDVAPAYRTIWEWQGWSGSGAKKYIAFTKGAVDGLLGISDRVWVKDRVEALNPEWKKRIEDANQRLAMNGMRVLGVACRRLENLPSENDGQPEKSGLQIAEPDEFAQLERDLILIGLVGMIDPAREEVKQSIATCREAGIRPMMITGDHPLTAGYIARELGLIVDESPSRTAASNATDFLKDRVLTGQEFDRLSAAEIEQAVEKISVFARVSPEHKLRIVKALQNKGEIVAMTGDGVNDAPALRKADIGVAMGITGTDVSKEASDMVLLDDNFATIVAAVREGRIIYDNIRRFIQYTLTSNAGEIWVMLLAPFLGMPLALLPIQILWINLVTDGLPGLALSVEKGERDTMQRPPHPPNENVFGRGLGSNVLWIGFLMGFLSLGVGYWYWRMDSPYWQTMVFTTLTMSEMGYVMSIRSFRDSLLSIGVFSNRTLLGAVSLTVLLQMAVVYVPFMQRAFHTTALPLPDLLLCLGLSTTLLWVVELQKWIKLRMG